MNAAVLADAQFSVVRTFKPFAGFETVYAGQPVQTPIAIPGTLDGDAGKPGFDANLISGMPVPLGAKLMVWVPTIFNQRGPDLIIQPQYKYTFLWRVRNIRDFRENRTAYHFPKQSLGVNAQFVIPSAANGLLYQNNPVSAPTGGTTIFTEERDASQEFVKETVRFTSTVTNAPLTPQGNVGAFQQGLAQAEVGSNTSVTYNSFQLDCLGDELIILVSRAPVVGVVGGELWDFTDNNLDAGFSAFFGTDNGTRAPIADLGVYLLNGSNP